MSNDEVKLLADKIDGVATRVSSLEGAVTDLMTKLANHDKVLRWLKLAGVLLLGAALGSGAVKIDDILGLMSAS